MFELYMKKFQGFWVLYKKSTFNAFEVTFLEVEGRKIEGMVRLWSFLEFR